MGAQVQLAEQLGRLHRGEHHFCVNIRRRVRQPCFECDWNEKYPEFTIKDRKRRGKRVWNFAVENNLVGDLAGPGACFALYHGPDPVNLDGETPRDRELFLEMVIQDARYDYLEEYGTVETIKTIIKYGGSVAHRDWIVNMLDKHPVTEEIAILIVKRNFHVPHFYRHIAMMGDLLFDHCGYTANSFLRYNHPNPERYLERHLDNYHNDLMRLFQHEKPVPLDIEGAMNMLNDFQGEFRNDLRNWLVLGLSYGMDKPRLVAYGAMYGLHWLPLANFEQQEIATKYGVDLGSLPIRFIDCTPIQRFVKALSIGFLRLKPDPRCAKAASHEQDSCDICCDLQLIQSLKDTIQKVEPGIYYPFLS